MIHPLKNPRSIRGIKTMIRLAKFPLVVPIEIKGVNTNEVRVGESVLMTKLRKPKTKPIPAPNLFPKRIPARITGICSVVARRGPIGTKPKGVVERISIIALKNEK